MNQPRGKPFQPGNKFGKGRPRGSRNKVSAEAQQLLEQFTVPLIRKCIALALKDDRHALKLCVERVLPALRDRPVNFRMATVAAAGDLGKAELSVFRGISAGRLAPAEAETLMNVIAIRRKSIETDVISARIEELERAGQERPREAEER